MGAYHGIQPHFHQSRLCSQKSLPYKRCPQTQLRFRAAITHFNYDYPFQTPSVQDNYLFASDYTLGEDIADTYKYLLQFLKAVLFSPAHISFEIFWSSNSFEFWSRKNWNWCTNLVETFLCKWLIASWSPQRPRLYESIAHVTLSQSWDRVHKESILSLIVRNKYIGTKVQEVRYKRGFWFKMQSRCRLRFDWHRHYIPNITIRRYILRYVFRIERDNSMTPQQFKMLIITSRGTSALLLPKRKLLDDVCHAHQVTVYPETFYLIVNRTSLVYLSRSFFYHKYFQDHTSITSTILQFCDDKANLQSYLKCWNFYNIDQ